MSSKPNPTVNPDDYLPFDDFIMLEPEQVPEKTDGGIIIPEQARAFLSEGKVLKVGGSVNSQIKPGMFVTFDAASEYRLDLGNKIVFVVRESNLILYRKDHTKTLFPA